MSSNLVLGTFLAMAIASCYPGHAGVHGQPSRGTVNGILLQKLEEALLNNSKAMYEFQALFFSASGGSAPVISVEICVNTTVASIENERCSQRQNGSNDAFKANLTTTAQKVSYWSRPNGTDTFIWTNLANTGNLIKLIENEKVWTTVLSLNLLTSLYLSRLVGPSFSSSVSDKQPDPYVDTNITIDLKIDELSEMPCNDEFLDSMRAALVWVSW